MFQFLSSKRNGPVSAQSGPELAVIPTGNDDTLDLGDRIAVSRALYDEAIRLAEAHRAWLDGPCHALLTRQTVKGKAAISVENLAITARLMAAIAWLSAPHMPRHHPGSPPELPADHPLRDMPGGQISTESRRLLADILRNS
jgi:hypothetical protein